MGLFTVPFDAFGGLDLSDAANESGGAIDVLNVEFDKPGRLRSRDGYTQLSVGAADLVTSMVQHGVSGNFVTNGPSQARVYDSTGATVASSSALTGISYNLVNFAVPGSNYVYGPAGTSNTRILRWDGATWTYPNVGYNARFVSATPWDNRLVLLIDFATANASRVRFSDPGLPETYTANNYVDLTPGDNEAITGVCTWRNQLFVFKNTKYFVFYGTSTDSTGNPIFNYRTINTGTGAGAFAASLASPVAMDDGVYFINGKGLYRTTGGPPEKMSTAVDPLFGIGSAPYLTTTLGNNNSPVVTKYRKKVLMCFGSATPTGYTLVFDTERGTWTVWDIPATYILEYSPSAGAASVALISLLSGVIHKMSSASTTDNGTAITSRYRSPFIPLDWRGRNLRSGIHGVDKTVRESIVEGTGNVNYALTNQWATTIPATAALTLGASPAVAEARDRRSVRGRMFSFQLSGTTPWEVQTVSWNIYSYQAAGEQSELV